MAGPASVVRAVARIAFVGALAALAVWGAGALMSRTRLGPTDEAAVRRVEIELGQRFRDASESLAARATEAGPAIPGCYSDID